MRRETTTVGKVSTQAVTNQRRTSTATGSLSAPPQLLRPSAEHILAPNINSHGIMTVDIRDDNSESALSAVDVAGVGVALRNLMWPIRKRGMLSLRTWNVVVHRWGTKVEHHEHSMDRGGRQTDVWVWERTCGKTALPPQLQWWLE